MSIRTEVVSVLQPQFQSLTDFIGLNLQHKYFWVEYWCDNLVAKVQGLLQNPFTYPWPFLSRIHTYWFIIIILNHLHYICNISPQDLLFLGLCVKMLPSAILILYLVHKISPKLLLRYLGPIIYALTLFLA